MDKHNFYIILISLALIALIAVAFPGVWMLSSECPFEKQNVIDAWVDEGTLGYYMSALSTIATIALSCVTVWQSWIIAQRQEQHENENTERPYFASQIIRTKHRNGEWTSVKCDINGFFQCDKGDQIRLEIKNQGNGPAVYCITYPITEFFGEVPDELIETKYVAKESTMSIKMPVLQPESGMREQTFSIYYANLLGCVYKQTFTVTWELVPQKCSEVMIDNETYCDYELTIIVKISPLSAQTVQRNLHFKTEKQKYSDIKNNKDIEHKTFR